MSNYSLSRSVQACKQLTALSRSNFAPAFALLPSAKRQAMQILYAYTRFTDDLVDLPDFDPKTGQEIPINLRRKKQKLNQWVSVLEAVLGKIGEPHGSITSAEDEAGFEKLAKQFLGCGGLVLLPALKMIVDKFQIPKEPLFHLIDGIEYDLEPKPFELFDDSAEYCHQVATSVGFVSLAIWGTKTPLFSDNVIKAAKACGIAFQWTNILRDLYEDYHNGRIYLPQDELQRLGLTPNQFGTILDREKWMGQKNLPKNTETQERYTQQQYQKEVEQFEEKFLKLMQRELNRCEVYYENSMPLYKIINKDSRRMFGLMWNTYYELFNKMRRNPWQVCSAKRVRLRRFKKLQLWLHWRFMPCFRLR